MSGKYRDFEQVQASIPYFQFPRLALNTPLMHGVFSRHGGAGTTPFDSLNVSDSVGDRPEAVSENIRRIKDVFHPDRLVHLHQCHGDHVVVIGQEPYSKEDALPAADAVITNVPRIALMVKQADCQGVIIYDPRKSVIANVHCGWRGNVQNILATVVSRMREVYDCNGSDLLAAIGPSLGPCCAEFVTYKDIFPQEFMNFMVRQNYFDLWALSCYQLQESGLDGNNIEVAGVCTRCRPDLFYSYRAEGVTGRFGTVVMLR